MRDYLVPPYTENRPGGITTVNSQQPYLSVHLQRIDHHISVLSATARTSDSTRQSSTVDDTKCFVLHCIVPVF